MRDAVIAYTTSVKHRGKLHTVEISEFRILQCELCAALVFNDEADEQISRALRKKLGLLQPEEIRRMRIACDWSQRNLADAMHAARATVCRWEKGILIQSKRSDEALRACLAKASLQEPVPFVVAHPNIETDNIDEKIRFWFQSLASELLAHRPDPASRKVLAAFLAGQETFWADVIDMASKIDAGQEEAHAGEVVHNTHLRAFHGEQAVFCGKLDQGANRSSSWGHLGAEDDCLNSIYLAKGKARNSSVSLPKDPFRKSDTDWLDRCWSTKNARRRGRDPRPLREYRKR